MFAPDSNALNAMSPLSVKVVVDKPDLETQLEYPSKTVNGLLYGTERATLNVKKGSVVLIRRPSSK
jgi:uncharacterized protein YlxW (UPF0749 family)